MVVVAPRGGIQQLLLGVGGLGLLHMVGSAFLELKKAWRRHDFGKRVPVAVKIMERLRYLLQDWMGMIFNGEN